MRKRLYNVFGGCTAIWLVYASILICSSAATEDTTAVVTKKYLTGMRAMSEAELKGKYKAGLDRILSATQGDFEPDVADEFAEFLQNEDPRVQMLGTAGLMQTAEKKHAEILHNYLKSKDFRDLENLANHGKMSTVDYRDTMRAALFAVSALGKVGDKGDIRLLEKLLRVEDLKLESGGSPVEMALVELGAVDSLTSVTNDDDHRTIDHAAIGIGKIRDPKKVPKLMATVMDPNCADQVRFSAGSALAEIKAPGTKEFLLKVIQREDFPSGLRSGACLDLGRCGYKSAESDLKKLIEHENPAIGAYAYAGLMYLDLDKYLDGWFQKIMDPSNDRRFRGFLYNGFGAIPKEIARKRKEDIYKLLSATEADGTPADSIRRTAWSIIFNLFNEFAEIQLSSRNCTYADSIRGFMETELGRRNAPISYLETRRMAQEEFDKIATFYDEKQKGGKE